MPAARAYSARPSRARGLPRTAITTGALPAQHDPRVDPLPAPTTSRGGC